MLFLVLFFNSKLIIAVEYHTQIWACDFESQKQAILGDVDNFVHREEKLTLELCSKIISASSEALQLLYELTLGPFFTKPDLRAKSRCVDKRVQGHEDAENNSAMCANIFTEFHYKSRNSYNTTSGLETTWFLLFWSWWRLVFNMVFSLNWCVSSNIAIIIKCSAQIKSTFIFCCNCNYILFTKLPRPGDSERTFRSSSQAATCPFNCWTSSGETVNTNFCSLWFHRLGIEPESTAPAADALSTRPLIGETTVKHSC